MSEGDEDVGYRTRLTAQTTRWRLGLGVSSWSLAALAIGFIAIAVLGNPWIRIDGPGRAIGYATPCVLTFAGLGWVLLRVGEIDVTTGRVVRAAPVPWTKIVPLVGAVALLAALVIAWPLGVYTSVRAASSVCGQLVSLDTLRAHTTLRLSFASLDDGADGCDAWVHGAGRSSASALLRTRAVPDDHEWRTLLTRFHPDHRTPLDVTNADEALLLENDDVFVIAIRHGNEGSFVQLRRDAFDRAAAMAIADEITP